MSMHYLNYTNLLLLYIVRSSHIVSFSSWFSSLFHLYYTVWWHFTIFGRVLFTFVFFDTWNKSKQICHCFIWDLILDTSLIKLNFLYLKISSCLFFYILHKKLFVRGGRNKLSCMRTLKSYWYRFRS